MVQPYTKEDLDRGEKIVRELHGLQGYDAWAERIAKEIASVRKRERAACVAVAEATCHEHCAGDGELYIVRKVTDAIQAGR